MSDLIQPGDRFTYTLDIDEFRGKQGVVITRAEAEAELGRPSPPCDADVSVWILFDEQILHSRVYSTSAHEITISVTLDRVEAYLDD